MAYFKITAENVRNKDRLLAELRSNPTTKRTVCLAGTDPTFSSAYMVVIDGTEVQAQTVQDLLWQYNGGAYCTVRTMSEDEYEELC